MKIYTVAKPWWTLPKQGHMSETVTEKRMNIFCHEFVSLSDCESVIMHDGHTPTGSPTPYSSLGVHAQADL